MKRRILNLFVDQSIFLWDHRFSNTDVNQKIHLFNRTTKNILYNFVPHESVTCDNRDLHESIAK